MANTILVNKFDHIRHKLHKLFYIISFLGLIMLLDLRKTPLGPNDPMQEVTLSTPVSSAQGRIDTSDQLVINYTETPDSALTNKTILSSITEANTATRPPNRRTDGVSSGRRPLPGAVARLPLLFWRRPESAPQRHGPRLCCCDENGTLVRDAEDVGIAGLVTCGSAAALAGSNYMCERRWRRSPANPSGKRGSPRVGCPRRFAA